MSKEKRSQTIDKEEVSKQETQDGVECNVDEKNPVDDNVAETDAAVKSDVEKMAEEATQWRDKYVRLSAEFDNYRKRTLKEKMELVSSAGEDVIKSLLPVMDDLERALAATEKSTDVEAVREGVVLISNKLRDTLRGKGLMEIEAFGQELDTDFHEAVAKIPAPEETQKGKIVDVVQKGYKLHDKVIRHSKVVVGEAASCHQFHYGTTEQVGKGDIHSLFRRIGLACLSPHEVAGFVVGF